MALTLLLGGARSGKSDAAVRLAIAHAAPVVLIATAEARDADMAERIERHRRERPADWVTVEEPLALRAALTAAPEESCVVLDCLTVWAANALERLGAEEALHEARAAAAAARARPGPTIAVTNEVGLGVVPDKPLGRAYRDLLGRVNVAWAEAAERALLLVAGRALELAHLDPAEAGAR
jgi:adenosylcobinamide kinase / adenosylcobinamide-phosphate guanylyltransferase